MADLIDELSDIPADLAEGLENLIYETPSDGGALEEITEEIAPLIEDLAEKLSELSDASAEITAQIVEASKAERVTAKLDEERGDIFDEIEDEIDDVLPSGNGGLILTLLLFGAGVLFMQKFKRNKDERPAPIDERMTQETKQYIDAFGIVHNG